MYESYYGLRELPFELTANPRYLFLTARHREALSNLQYGISGRRGVTLLVGEAGTGKTTLVRAALESEAGQTHCVYMSNPALTREEFIEFLARAFALSDRAAASKTALLYELEPVLRARKDQGLRTALFVDEAQALPTYLLEEVRLLANIETDTEKLLSVVLAGQLQLSHRLNEPELRQLKQRVALRCDLLPLDLRETAAYIAARVGVAGGDSAELFTREAVELVHSASRGIPRTISVICDNALVTAFAANRKPVTSDIVAGVCRDFDVQGAAAPAAPTAPAIEADPAPRPEPPAERSALDSMFSVFSRRRRFSLF
jgi:general secretion pathway protein A